MRVLIFSIIIFIFYGCSTKYPVQKDEYKKSIDSILSSKLRYRNLAFTGRCNEYESKYYEDSETQKEFYDSLKKYCTAQGGQIITHQNLMKKYAQTYNLKDLYNRQGTPDTCWTRLSRDKLYCLKNDKILFNFPKRENMYKHITVTSYTYSNKKDKNIIQQKVYELNKKQQKFKKIFQNDIEKYTKLIKNKKINIIDKPDNIKKSFNDKYYFRIIPKQVIYKDNILKFVLPFGAYRDASQYGIHSVNATFLISQITLTNSEKFTGKLLNRLTKKFSVRIIGGGEDRIIALDKVYSDGKSRYDWGNYRLNIQFYSKIADTNKFRYTVLLEVSEHINNAIERNCHYLTRRSTYYEDKKLEKLFENIGDKILNYKDIDCEEHKVFQAKKYSKIIIYDQILRKVIYIAYKDI